MKIFKGDNVRSTKYHFTTYFVKILIFILVHWYIPPEVAMEVAKTGLALWFLHT